jgi:Domain of unknown function (DUF929)
MTSAATRKVEMAKGGGTAGSTSGNATRGGKQTKAARTAQERARRVIEQQRKERIRRQSMIASAVAVAVIIVVVVIMVAVKVTSSNSGSTTATPTGTAAASVIDSVTKVPASVLDTVGKGSQVDVLPKSINVQQSLTADNKPLVVYIGAEYCPFCAAQRWPVTVALARFGTFTGLGLSHSASDDSFPNTQTLSFHGSTYTSQYLSFQGVETSTNIRQGSGYTKLDTLTPLQNQVMTLNAPPYVSQDAAGSIPFLDFGNKYVIAGSSFSPELLSNKSATQIAAAINDPGSAIGKSVNGAANAFTAAICKLTGGQPGDVCTSAGVKAYSGLQ